MNTMDSDRRGVGPVLQATPFAEAVVAAIQDENDDVVVRHEGRIPARAGARRVPPHARCRGGHDRTGCAISGRPRSRHVLLHRADAAHRSAPQCGGLPVRPHLEHPRRDEVTSGRPPARKTYSRLATSRRMPTEYEVVSTDLHYNYPDGFELTDTPVIDWYRRHREGSKLCSTDWGSFADPRRTTYRSYTELQDKKEDVIDGLLRQVDDDGYDDELSDAWVDFIDHWYAPLRFPVHGLQMLAAYVAQMAPASRVTNCAAFQAADEMRRVQRIAYRTAQLADHRSGIDVDDAPASLGGSGGLPTLARAH